MKQNAAPVFGAVLGLALIGAGTCHALSLRGSAAELSFGDALPGATVVGSKVGARLRVENPGPETLRLEFAVVPPRPEGLKDGWEPWPHADGVSVAASRSLLNAGEAADVEVAVKVPDVAGLSGGQYQFDVLETGKGSAGESLTLKTRGLLAVGTAPATDGDIPAGGWTRRPGFTLAPQSAAVDGVRLGRIGDDPEKGSALKIVNAGDEDLTVTLSPARDWDAEARVQEGYDAVPNPNWLRFEPKVLKVRAGAIGRARVWAEVPSQKRYAGRRWAFVAAFDGAAERRVTRRYFVLNVKTEDWEAKARIP
jgi:hypothetical protein